MLGTDPGGDPRGPKPPLGTKTFLFIVIICLIFVVEPPSKTLGLPSP